VTVERKSVCARTQLPCQTTPDPFICFVDVPQCKPCASPADCPPEDFLVADLCLYTNHIGTCGEYEFACGWLS
jgi:hypothetical protein